MWIDGKNFFKSLEEDNYAMAGLYFSSALSSLVGAGVLAYIMIWKPIGLALMAATGIGTIFLLIGLAAGILIAVFHKNELQKWLRYCILGKDHKPNREGYRTLEEELEGLKGILGTKAA